MSEQNLASRSRRTLHGVVLGGTALALVMGGVLVGGSTDLLRVTPANAAAVRVEGVAPFSFADVVEQVRPAVVSVRVRGITADVALDGEGEQFFDFPPGSQMDRFFRQFRRQIPRDRVPRRRNPTSLGSGFVISEDGLVVTNNHVIDENESVVVILENGVEYDAVVIGTDDRTDLALLKIESSDTFTYVGFSQEEPRVGDWVVAVGNPFGLGGTVTAGIISAIGRQIGSGPYDDFLQIDAAVNRGNSGGPAFNYRGEVVGVNTAIFSPSGGNVGIAFAIPASTAQRIVDDLIDDGMVVRGWLGVEIQNITDEIAESLRLGDQRGALVTRVTAGSPAQGLLEIGDAVTAVNGQPIADSRGLAVLISRMRPGDIAKVTVARAGETQEVDVALGRLPTTDQLASLTTSRTDDDTVPSATSLSDFGLALVPSDDGV
ncbi:MAG: trypsin-like peptidase domain-containing protein, partial [Alphaproteobacteria bacterium]